MMRTIRGRDMILEEGTLSALCLAHSARSLPWDLLSILPHLTHGDQVVVINTDIDTTVERIRSRRGILSDRDIRELQSLVARYNAALSILAHALTPPPIEVLSDEPPNTVAARLKEAL